MRMVRKGTLLARMVRSAASRFSNHGDDQYHLRDAAERPLLGIRIGPLTAECQCRIKTQQKPQGNEYHHGRTAARATKTDAGTPAFLGGHASRRASPAALRRLRQRVFPAAPVLPGLRLPQS